MKTRVSLRYFVSYCSYHVYSWSYSHENVKNSSTFIISADGSKKSVTVWAKYLSTFEGSYLVFSENSMDY